MPKISLVVCLYRERDFMERLLSEMAGRFDDLVVVHDGPEQNEDSGQPLSPAKPIDYADLPYDAPLPPSYRQVEGRPQSGSIHELVAKHRGRFFEGPRSFQQEPHWPFAWWQARHDWILRLDADEFPSPEMQTWLQTFRALEFVMPETSGYTCIWPLWNGKHAVMKRWPTGRNFLINRERVRFFGMVEQTPVPDGDWTALALPLCHQPSRKSYGLANILRRRQGYLWRMVISKSLLGGPKDLPRWRWSEENWPPIWQRLRRQSPSTGIYHLLRDSVATMRAQWRAEKKLMPLMAVATPLHHFLISRQVHRKRSRHRAPR